MFSLEIEKKKYVLLDEICAAVGQMLAGFRTAINMLPGSAARWLIGLEDFHVIKVKLQTEVDSALNSLGRCRYLEDLALPVIERLFSDRAPEFRQGLEKCCAQVFIELGRESFKELQIDCRQKRNHVTTVTVDTSEVNETTCCFPNRTQAFSCW